MSMFGSNWIEEGLYEDNSGERVKIQDAERIREAAKNGTLRYCNGYDGLSRINEEDLHKFIQNDDQNIKHFK